MLKLTQCLIVKNEKQNFARAVNWGKKVVDELIVVDTGSSDGTEILAENLGAKVFHFDWKDDFSAARNFAISKCTGDWILFLDADEYFKAKDAPLLRTLIEKVDSEYDTSGKTKVKYNVIETPWINIGHDSPARQVRIFKNVPYLRYEGAVHEQLHALAGGYLKVYRAEDMPAVYHTGYVWSDDNPKGMKSERNFKAAEKALKKSPDCAKFQLFAAEALMDEKKYSEAEKYFSKAMINTDGSIWTDRAREGYKQWLSIYLNMNASGLIASADRVYKEAAAKFPDDADFDIILSLIHFKEKDIIGTIRFFNSSLSKKRGGISEKLMASNSEVYKKLSDICESLKKDNII